MFKKIGLPAIIRPAFTLGWTWVEELLKLKKDYFKIVKNGFMSLQKVKF